MERMNEILARTANRRISTRRVPTPGPSSTSSTSMSGTRHAASRRATPAQVATKPATKPDGGNAPHRPMPDTDTDSGVSLPKPPAADVLESDRILELPARPPASAARPSRARASEMTPLREAASAYAASGVPRRSGRGAPPAISPTPSARAGNGASSRGGGATGKPATTGRSARGAAGVSASGVCPLCHGAGYVRLDVPVGDPTFGQAIRCKCKEQQIEERDRLHLRTVSNLDPFRDKTFETFDPSLPGLREAYDTARRYAEDPLGWLVFRGGYGSGKTHLAAAIANVAEQSGQRVVFAIVPDLLDHLRATFAPNSDIAYDALFEKVRESALLVLDDFGAENSTAWATEKLFQLINYRYNYRMPTVITTNQRLLAHIDERIRSRLSDLGLVRHVLIEAADYRERHTGRPSRGGGRGRTR